MNKVKFYPTNNSSLSEGEIVEEREDCFLIRKLYEDGKLSQRIIVSKANIIYENNIRSS